MGRSTLDVADFKAKTFAFFVKARNTFIHEILEDGKKTAVNYRKYLYVIPALVCN